MALRSLKNLMFPHEVFLFGHCPTWCTGVVHVPTPAPPVIDYMSFLDTHRKMWTAATDGRVSDRFVVMYDDTYFIAPTRLQDIERPRAIEDLSVNVDWNTYGKAGGASRKWVDLLRKVMEQMKKEGRPQYNYETHLPRLVDKRKVEALVERHRMLSEPWNFFSLYFNTYNTHLVELIGRTGGGYKMGVYWPKTLPELRAMRGSNKVLNNGRNAFDAAFVQFLQELFPEPSPYEADAS